MSSLLPISSFTVRDHQKEAIADILSELASQRQTKLSRKSTVSRKVPPTINRTSSIDARAQSIMACGTGKTMISQRLADALTGHDDVKTSVIGSNTVLVCVPSLSLVKQTLASYLKFEGKPFIPMVVCSASDAIKSAREKAVPGVSIDSIALDLESDERSDDDELGNLENESSALEQMRAEDHPPTTDSKDVAGFLKKAATDPDRLHIIFSTYHSSKVVADAQKIVKKSGKTHRFSLIAADEAHNLTGIHDRDYATILHESKIGADNRVFATATPKLFEKQSSDDVGTNSAKSVCIASMDDESLFGPVAHRLPFRAAVEKKLLVNYKTILLEVDQDEIDQFLAKSNRNTGIEIITDEKVMLSKQKDALAKIAMSKVLHELSLRRVISYHSRISDAESFVGSDGNGELSRYVKRSPSLKEFSTSIYGEAALNIREDCISSRTKSTMRSEILAQFEEKTDEPFILSSVHCLGEGVDVPDLNAVMFVDPRTSTSDVVQIIGRTMRLASEGVSKDIGYVILPVVVNKRNTIEDRLKDSSYKKVWAVIKGLMAVDSDFSNDILNIKNLIGAQRSQKGIESSSDNLTFEREFQALQNTILENIVIVDVSSASAPGQIKNAVLNTRSNLANLDEKNVNSHSSLRMNANKMAAGLVLKIVNECTDGNKLNINAHDLSEVHAEMELFKAENGSYPKISSGIIKRTTDSWIALNDRMRKVIPPTSLSLEARKLSGIKLTGVIVGLSDFEIIHKHMEAFKLVNGHYPKSTSGKIEHTDSTWESLDCKMKKDLSPPTTLVREGWKLSGIAFGERKKNIDLVDLPKHLEVFMADNGYYPKKTTKSLIKDMDENWRSADSRLRKLTPSSTLAQEVEKVNKLLKRINEQDLSELHRHMEIYFVDHGEYPRQLSGKVKNTGDSWCAVDIRLRKSTPTSSLCTVGAKLQSLKNIDVNNLCSPESKEVTFPITMPLARGRGMR